jgi:hypothetical protein
VHASFLAALSGACLFLFISLAAPAFASPVDAPPQPAEPEAVEADAPADAAAEAGVRVYVDPATGRRTSVPAAATRGQLEAAIARDRAFSQSTEGLVEEPAPGGGTLMHLQGRFQSTFTATRDADGKLVFGCSDATHSALGPHDHAVPAPAREDR